MIEPESDQTRDRILRAAAEIFADRGFHETSVRAICEKAGTNVAAVNYYFRSKEQLYIEVFRMLFEGFRKPLLAIPDKVCDAASWREALREWVSYTIRISTDDKPPALWITQLIARERMDPTSAMPILYEQFFEPLRMAVERIVRMGMPQDAAESEVRIVSMSLMSQCTVFHNRKPPWDKLMYPSGVSRDVWIEQMSEFIAGSIISRFSFRTARV